MGSERLALLSPVPLLSCPLLLAWTLSPHTLLTHSSHTLLTQSSHTSHAGAPLPECAVPSHKPLRGPWGPPAHQPAHKLGVRQQPAQQRCRRSSGSTERDRARHVSSSSRRRCVCVCRTVGPLTEGTEPRGHRRVIESSWIGGVWFDAGSQGLCCQQMA